MAWTSMDNVAASLAAGKQIKSDFFKLTGGAAHVAGNCYDLSMTTGNPIANTYPGTALNSVAPNDTTGWGIAHGGNVSSDVKALLNTLATIVGTTSAPGIAMLIDVALYYPGIDLKSTSLQTMVQSAALSRYTNGKGLRPYIVVTTQSGGTPASTPVMSVFNYRDQDDNDAALSAGTINFTAGAAAIPPVTKIVHCAPAAGHPGPFLPWNAGDTGVKRVNTFQLSTAYTGATTTTGCIVLCKPLAYLPLVGIGVPSERSFFNPAPLLPLIPDGACLSMLYYPGAATAANSALMGALDFGWG